MQNFLETALRFISQYALVFYGLGVLGLLIYLNRARVAHRQMRMTPFPIEREEANANVRDALVIAVIFAAILGATIYIDRILLAPETDEGGIRLPIALNGDSSQNGEEEPEGTRTASPSVQPSATSPAIGPTPEMSPTAGNTPEPTAPPTVAETETTAPTPALPPSPVPEPSPTEGAQQVPPTELPTAPTEPPQPTATEAPPETPTTAPSPIPTQAPQPTAPQVPGASCPTAGVQIASPGNGAVVSGSVNIAGTADIPDFQFYKVEYSQGTSQSNFASIGDIIAAPVNGGRLTTWNTGGFAEGVYALRLTVVNVSGNFPAPCTIFVVVQ